MTAQQPPPRPAGKSPAGDWPQTVVMIAMGVALLGTILFLLGVAFLVRADSFALIPLPVGALTLLVTYLFWKRRRWGLWLMQGLLTLSCGAAILFPPDGVGVRRFLLLIPLWMVFSPEVRVWFAPSAPEVASTKPWDWLRLFEKGIREIQSGQPKEGLALVAEGTAGLERVTDLDEEMAAARVTGRYLTTGKLTSADPGPVEVSEWEGFEWRHAWYRLATQGPQAAREALALEREVDLPPDFDAEVNGDNCLIMALRGLEGHEPERARRAMERLLILEDDPFNHDPTCRAAVAFLWARLAQPPASPEEALRLLVRRDWIQADEE